MSLIVVILSLAVVLTAEAQLVQETGSDGSGVYGTVGVGIANIDRGPGIGVPLGVTMLNERYRLIFSGSFLDLIGAFLSHNFNFFLFNIFALSL